MRGAVDGPSNSAPGRARDAQGGREVGRIDERLAQRGGTVEWLRLPAWLFAGAVRLRAALYDHELLPRARLGVPVVSIGNLTTGGAGKSPVTRWLAQCLIDKGWRPGVLSRGYAAAAGQVADEAQELEAYLPAVPHIENPDRVAGGAELEALGVDLILLDDGFQHRKLKRDLDLVLVDALRPWGLAKPRDGGHSVRALLPRGLLREPLTALARADAVWITRTDSVGESELLDLRREIERHAPGTAILECRHRPLRLRALVACGTRADATGAEWKLSDLRDQQVDLLSAIGNPEGFEHSVRELGAHIVEHRRRPDHHSWSVADLADLGARPVLTTGKDAPKLAALGTGILPADLLVLEIGIEITAGEAALLALLEALPWPPARRRREALHEGLHG